MDGPLPPSLSLVDGGALLDLAVAAIRAELAAASADGLPSQAEPHEPALHRLGCSFVTIVNGGRLRGCIGSLRPVQPLYRDVVHNARRATTDPRMLRVSISEWPCLSVSVCVLGEPEQLPMIDLADLGQRLRPGRDGLVIGVGAREVTFLPSVWQKLADPGEFVAALLAKGGWRSDRLPGGCHGYRYATAEFHAATEPGQVSGPALTGPS